MLFPFRNIALTTCVRVGLSWPKRRSRQEDRRLRRALLAGRRMRPVMRSAHALFAFPAAQGSNQRPPTFRACLCPIRPKPITPMRRRRDSGRTADFVGTATGILTLGVCGVGFRMKADCSETRCPCRRVFTYMKHPVANFCHRHIHSVAGIPQTGFTARSGTVSAPATGSRGRSVGFAPNDDERTCPVDGGFLIGLFGTSCIGPGLQACDLQS